jgi:hypothetical protein
VPLPYFPQTPEELDACVTPHNTQFLPGNIRRYHNTGVDPDWTNAIQSALNVGTQKGCKNVPPHNVGSEAYIPAGTYHISSPLDVTMVNGKARRIYGDGMEVSIIRVNGAIDAFTCSSMYLRITMQDFRVFGDSATGSGITFGPTALVYESLFMNIYAQMGGRAFYLPNEFSSQLINCQGGSYNDNVFELQGGSATKLQGCYAHEVPVSKYGYRLYGGGFLDSCNGIDMPFVGGIATGGDWGLFGQDMAHGDPTLSQYNLVMINCNVEDFNNEGVRFRYDGVAKIMNCTFFAKAIGTYQSEIHIEYCSLLITLENIRIGPKGATRLRLSPVYVDSASCVLALRCESALTMDVAGNLYPLPTLTATFPAPGWYEAAAHFNSLAVSQFYNHYCGTATLAAGTATVTLTPPQFDANYQVILTGNQPEAFRCVSKSTGSFEIASSNAVSTANVDWFIARPSPT